MRPLLLPSLGFATLLLAGCSGDPNGDNASGNAAAPEDRFTVRAGPVANAQLDALSGTFQVLKSGSPDAIPSALIGGACLAFPAADLGFTQMAAKQCSKNSDCSTPGENEFGYCDTQAGTCWARPAGPAARAAFCDTGKVRTLNDINSVPVQPVDASQFRIRSGSKVRVVACLNKTGATRTGCASNDGPDRIEVLGPVATIR